MRIQHTLFLFIFALASSLSTAQTHNWENLAVSSINTEKSHSHYEPAGKVLLNGNWQFAYFKHPSQVPTNFFLGKGITQWDAIKVPSNWQLQSNRYDPPVFTNIKYPFEMNPPYTLRTTTLRECIERSSLCLTSGKANRCSFTLQECNRRWSCSSMVSKWAITKMQCYLPSSTSLLT